MVIGLRFRDRDEENPRVPALSPVVEADPTVTTFLLRCLKQHPADYTSGKFDHPEMVLRALKRYRQLLHAAMAGNMAPRQGGGYYAYVASKFSHALIVIDPDPNGDGDPSDGRDGWAHVARWAGVGGA
jgi:hypothetical protein